MVVALRSTLFRGDPELSAVAAGELRLGRRGDPPHPAPIRSAGNGVAKVQHALVELAYPLPHFGEDGRYGNETYAAVLAYKRRNGIRTTSGYLDGIVGPLTVRRLDADLLALSAVSSSPLLAQTEIGGVWVERDALRPPVAAAQVVQAGAATCTHPPAEDVLSRISAAPFRFVCRLDVAYYTPTRPHVPPGMPTPTASATGILVSPRHVLTAAHVLYTRHLNIGMEFGPTGPRSIDVHLQQRQSRELPGSPISAASWCVPDTWKAALDAGPPVDRNDDYGLITLAHPVPAGYGFWGATGTPTVLTSLGAPGGRPEPRVGATVHEAGYPGSCPQQSNAIVC